jgi:hypothetical protein
MLAVISYGHRSQVSFQCSVFLNAGTVKTNTSVFCHFFMISDEGGGLMILLLEIAKRYFAEDIAGKLIQQAYNTLQKDLKKTVIQSGMPAEKVRPTIACIR